MQVGSEAARFRCPNCGGLTPTILNSADARQRPPAMSDGQYLRSGAAIRVLCAQCGCIGIVYSPEDCLQHYFESDYDVSSSIQNNLVVVENREVVPKRSRVYGLLFE